MDLQIVESFKNLSDFQALVASDPGGMEKIAEQQSINIAKTFESMVTITDLLQVAHSAAEHFPCSVPIMEIMCRYQSTVNESETSVENFINHIISALKKHSLAKKAISKNKPEKAIEMVTKCGARADKMSKEAGVLSEKAQQLIDLSTKALTTATNDKSITNDQKRKVQERMAKAKELEAALQKSVDELLEAENQAAEEEQKFAKKADAERKNKFIKDLVVGVTRAMGDIAKAAASATPEGATAQAASSFTQSAQAASSFTQSAQAASSFTQSGTNNDTTGGEATGTTESDGDEAGASQNVNQDGNGSDPDEASGGTTLEDLEAMANQRKWRIREQKRKTNSELAGLLTEMKNLSESNDDLLLAIKSLETVIVAMGKVKTTFDLVKKFWQQVKVRCEKLADIGDVVDEIELSDTNDEMLEVIQESGSEWIQLGVLNMVAYNAIVRVTNKTNKFMSTLPRGEERKAIVMSLSDKLLSSAALDDSRFIN